MVVIFAEKPSVGAKIAAALGGIKTQSGTIDFSELDRKEKTVKALQANGYLDTFYAGKPCIVTWGYGHLVELKQAKDYCAEYAQWKKMPLPFVPERYEIRLKEGTAQMSERIKRQMTVISRAFRHAEYIVNATDFDREGEVIFSYIYEYTGATAPVKRACFTSQTKEGFVQAFKTLRPGSEMKKIDAAGRARNIADWLVGANLTVGATLFSGGDSVMSIGRVQTPTLKIVVDRELEIRNFQPVPYWTLDAVFTTQKGETYKGKCATDRFMSRADASALLRKISKHGTVVSLEKKCLKKEVPNLYSIAALQMDANAIYGYTLKDTLDTVQKLYEGGYVTYPRTSSQYLTEDMEPVVNAVLDRLSTVSEYRRLLLGKARAFDFPHWFDDSKVSSHYAIIPTGQIPENLSDKEMKIFDLIARSVIRMCYAEAVIEQTKIVTSVNTTDAEPVHFLSTGTVVSSQGWYAVTPPKRRDGEESLPSLSEGEIVEGAYTDTEHMTEPPKRFTDKTLLAAMISAGKQVEDAELKKILMDPSVNGIGTGATRDSILETLIRRGYMERQKKSFVATERGIRLIQNIPIEEVKSPELTARWEQRLANIANGKESAETFLGDIEAAVKQWCESLSTNKEQIAVKPAPDAEYRCPVCGEAVLRMPWGWRCKNYENRNCTFEISNKILGKTIGKQNVLLLMSGKRTGLIKGFISKRGKPFDAYLQWDPESARIQFEFPRTS